MNGNTRNITDPPHMNKGKNSPVLGSHNSAAMITQLVRLNPPTCASGTNNGHSILVQLQTALSRVSKHSVRFCGRVFKLRNLSPTPEARAARGDLFRLLLCCNDSHATSPPPSHTRTRAAKSGAVLASTITSVLELHRLPLYLAYAAFFSVFAVSNFFMHVKFVHFTSHIAIVNCNEFSKCINEQIVFSSDLKECSRNSGRAHT